MWCSCMRVSTTLCLVLIAVSCAHGFAGPEKAGGSADADVSSRRELNARLLDAVRNEDTASVIDVLKAGASINARNEQRRTALMLAITGGHEVTERIIQEGLDARVEIIGLPAPPVRESQDALIDLLLSRGADLEASDTSGKSALMLAVERDYASIASRLIEAGSDPDARFASGLPLTCLAASRGFVRTLTVLANAGADVDAGSATGKQAIHYAAEANQIAVVKLLLERGVPVDTPSGGDWTSLHIAASLGYRELVAMLLAHGADVARLTPQSMTAEQVARARGYYETAELLIP